MEVLQEFHDIKFLCHISKFADMTISLRGERRRSFKG
jgi:hypothetical protein